MMGNSTGVGVGVMAVVAVSGSVMLVALQAHRRLVSEFMKKVQFELGHGDRDRHDKKKVRFAEDVLEPSTNNKEYRLKHSKTVHRKTRVELENSGKIPATSEDDDENPVVGERAVPMPLNRLALYKGIREHRMVNKRF